jgi:hypothetical protein
LDDTWFLEACGVIQILKSRINTAQGVFMTDGPFFALGHEYEEPPGRNKNLQLNIALMRDDVVGVR